MYVARMHVRGTDGCMDVRMNGGTDVCINGGTDVRINGGMNVRMNVRNFTLSARVMFVW